jgi:DNA topoisomerase-1
MSVAQKLYEQGHITYMRTDSINLSNLAISTIEKEVKKEYGDKYHKTRRYKSKSKGAQEAHEAIRPTYISNRQIKGDRDMQRLYELIWKRTIASQMADAEIEKTTVDIGISELPDRKLQAKGEVVKFDGFLKVYMESKDEDEEEEEIEGMLPPMKVGQKLDLKKMEAPQRFTRPPARYTEASLVKKLEQLGIGRPSTYSPTISRIMDPKRGYVTKESRDGEERKYMVYSIENGELKEKEETEITGATSNRLYSSDIGMVVTDFLLEHFDEVMDYSFTADIEKQFDDIAEGDLKWKNMLQEFYDPFHERVEKTLEEADRFTGERKLGKDPDSGRTVLTRMTKYGPVAQIGAPDELDEGEKPKYANLRKNQSIETIELEEALELFALPKEIGTYKGDEVIVNIGRYGPYVKFGDKFVSIPKGIEPLDVDLEQAMPWIKAKEKEDEPIAYYQDEPITQGKGRYGPYVKWQGMYANIPKKIDPENIDEETAIQLVKEKKEKEEKRFIHKWPKEKLSVQNGRWGPFIKYKRSNFSLPKGEDGKKMTEEEAKNLTLEDVKNIVEEQKPGTFKKKKKKGKGKKKKKG